MCVWRVLERSIPRCIKEQLKRALGVVVSPTALFAFVSPLKIMDETVACIARRPGRFVQVEGPASQ